MSEAAAPAEHHSRLIRAWHVLIGRDDVAAPPRDDSVSYAELVWAHFKRQEALGHEDESGAEALYRRRLQRFKTEHGKVLELRRGPGAATCRGTTGARSTRSSR